MRLRRLYLKAYKNLRDFKLTFGDPFAMVLVGPNGTGKSNVLEALIVIFRDLDLSLPASFAYELDYECNGAEVQIDADPARTKSTRITVDGEPWTPERLSRRAGGHYLPGFLFGYYSGPSNRMEQHFETHQSRFSTDLLEGVDRPLRPLLYARQVHSQFVLLSFFAASRFDSDVLTRFLRIEEFDSVLFVLKRPSWYNPGRKDTVDNPGDPRFWGARGIVRDFASRLYDLALAPLKLSTPSDQLLLYLKNREDLESLATGYENQAEFFKALESLYISDLVADVRTRVKVRDSESSLTFRELSEGEQQLLTVLGLLRFMEGRQGLVLLDEPDTHLNPAWSLEYVQLLRSYIEDDTTTQIVMATHDPLVVSGLTREEVRLMTRGDNGRIGAAAPDEDPQGMGVAGLLTSELYGLRSQLDLITLKALDRKRELATLPSPTEPQLRELAELNIRLEGTDFSKVTRDPLYKPYVDAMSELELRLGLRKATLTPAEIVARGDLAQRVVRRLLEDLGEPH